MALKTSLLASLLAATAVADRIQYKGADISSLLILERGGQTFANARGEVQPLEKIMADDGINTVRQRFWVDPADGDYNLAYNLELSKRVVAAGMDVYIDFHYSDNWADPGKQVTPAAWNTSTDIESLSWTLYNYTKSVMDAYAAVGITPNIVSIGNEITHGLLWPLGQLAEDLESNSAGAWYNVSRLLHSAAWGIKDSDLKNNKNSRGHGNNKNKDKHDPMPKIMVHLDNGWDVNQQLTWYANVLAQGPLSLCDFDQIAVSHYPFYNPNATFANLNHTLHTLAHTYPDKQIVVAETDYPALCTEPAYPFPADAAWIPISAEGQATWIDHIGDIVRSTPRGVGVFYWEAAWVGSSSLGSSCEDAILVDWETGKVRPGFAALGHL